LDDEQNYAHRKDRQRSPASESHRRSDGGGLGARRRTGHLVGRLGAEQRARLGLRGAAAVEHVGVDVLLAWLRGRRRGRREGRQLRGAAAATVRQSRRLAAVQHALTALHVVGKQG